MAAAAASTSLQVGTKAATDIGKVMSGSGDPSWLALYVCVLIIAVLSVLLYLSMRSNRLMSTEYVDASKAFADAQLKAHQARTEALLLFSGQLISRREACTPSARLFSILMPRSAARSNEAREAIDELERQSSERAQEQEHLAGIASCGTACDLRTSLQALSRKLAS